MLILVPSILTVLVCLVSPVDAYIRYMLPVMAAMPVNIAWCYYAVAKAKAGEKEDICDYDRPVFQKLSLAERTVP